MLALKLGLSLVNSNNPSGEWLPTDETSLQAWYQNKVGITLNGSDVSQWADSSSNSIDMDQATATEQPAYNASTGALTFASGDKTNLQTTGQIVVDNDFTLGIRFFPTTTNGTFVADNTTAGELFKISAAGTISIKINNSATSITLDSAEFGNQEDYIVITRASDVFYLYYNGTLQAATPTLAGIIDIDAIGIRRTDTNGFSGTIKEIQIFDSSNVALTNNINARLSTL
tara:strand:- start:4273 stop:4959 length:687 start_codon:yes stop_codon:yes gene_type:complete